MYLPTPKSVSSEKKNHITTPLRPDRCPLYCSDQGCFIGCPECDHVSGRRQTDLCKKGFVGQLPSHAIAVNGFYPNGTAVERNSVYVTSDTNMRFFFGLASLMTRLRESVMHTHTQSLVRNTDAQVRHISTQSVESTGFCSRQFPTLDPCATGPAYILPDIRRIRDAMSSTL